MPSLSLRIDDTILSIRTAGVLYKDDKVLLQVEDDGILIPGGHIEINEDSKSGLIREFKEELHIGVEVERMLGIGENFMNYGDYKVHNICFYFRLSSNDVNLPLSKEFKSVDEKGKELCFKWFSKEEIKALDIYPADMKDIILADGLDVKHFVYKESI